MKIGVYDTGVGGLTVLKELKERFPAAADYVYLGDTAHVPYGPRSPSQIESLSRDCARQLKGHGIQALIVACNTVSSVALEAVREVMHPVPVMGVVEPGVASALEALTLLGEGAPLLVLATRATINSHAYAKTLHDVLQARKAHPHLNPDLIPIFEQACPLLVPMIEEGWIDHPILHQTIAEYVRPYFSQRQPGVALLACTHYPWVHAAFEKALPGWKVVNSARAVAHQLEHSSWFVPGTQREKIEWIFTDPQVVPDFAKKWIQS